jgi:hypothetical protein
MATTGIRLLALMQGAWANVVRHNPEIQQGDWVAYYNGESKKGDTLWPGRAKVIDPGYSHKDKVVANWYGLNGNTDLGTTPGWRGSMAPRQKVLLQGVTGV